MNVKNLIAHFMEAEGFHKKVCGSFLDEQNNLYSQCL